MIDLPDKIDPDRYFNEGGSEPKSDARLIGELVEKYNQLIDYLDAPKKEGTL